MGSARQTQVLAAAAAVLTVTALPSQARAQVALSVNVETDYRLRGYSLSAGRPTATAQVAYDAPSGLYFSGVATGVLARDRARPLGFQANVGYARRLSPEVTIDAGLIHSEYGSGYSRRRSARYSEAYVGLIIDPISVRAFYSPNYFHPDVSTVYGEFEVGVSPATDWRLSAHGGALTYLKRPAYFYGSDATQFDWRLSASRQFGRLEVHAAVSGGGPGRDYYAGRYRDRTALTAGASFNF